MSEQIPQIPGIDQIRAGLQDQVNELMDSDQYAADKLGYGNLYDEFEISGVGSLTEDQNARIEEIIEAPDDSNEKRKARRIASLVLQAVSSDKVEAATAREKLQKQYEQMGPSEYVAAAVAGGRIRIAERRSEQDDYMHRRQQNRNARQQEPRQPDPEPQSGGGPEQQQSRPDAYDLTTPDGVRAFMTSQLQGFTNSISAFESMGTIPPEEWGRINEGLGRLDQLISGVVGNTLRRRNDLEAVNRVRIRLLNMQVREVGDRSMDRGQTFDVLALAVERDLGLNIKHAAGFVEWFRNMVDDMLQRHENDPIDLERVMSYAVGVYRMGFEDILRLLPRDLRGLDSIRGGISIHEFRESLENEMKFLSTCSVRRLMIYQNYGDLHKTAEQVASLAAEGGLKTLDADDYRKVGSFLPFFNFEMNDDGTYREGQENDVLRRQTDWSHIFKDTLARYFIMRRVWQDAVPVRYKKVGDEILVFGGKGINVKRMNADELMASGFFESLSNPAFGLKRDVEFAGDRERAAAFLSENGYVPNGFNVRVVSAKEFAKAHGTLGRWLVPGFYGRSEFRRLNGKKYVVRGRAVYRDGDPNYRGRWGTITLARDGVELDGNMFYAAPRVSVEAAKKIRSRLRVAAAGGDPNEVVVGSREWRRLERLSRIADHAANALMYSGFVVSFLDMEQGDSGLNLLLQTDRYMNVQARSARTAASGDLIGRVRRILPTLYEMWLIGTPHKFNHNLDVEVVIAKKVKRSRWPVLGKKQFGYAEFDKIPPTPLSFEEWMIRTGNEYEWNNIPFASVEGWDKPDKVVGGALPFAVQIFDHARGDQEINFGHISEPAPGPNAQPRIDDKVRAQCKALWKACYLWSAIPQLQNHILKLYRDEDGCYPALPPLELARQVFRALIVQNIEKHNPRGKFSQWTGIGAIYESHEISLMDEAAIHGMFDAFVKQLYDWGGRPIGSEGRLFSPTEVSDMLSDAGGGAGRGYLRYVLSRIIGI
jgi:hypothetical protein